MSTQQIGVGTIISLLNKKEFQLLISILSPQDYQYQSHFHPASDSDSWLPPCYLQNSNKYIKKIYWLCDKADCNQLIKLISCVLQQEGKIPSGGACPVVWFGTIALFFFTGSKIQQKKLIKSLLREKRKKKKKEVSLYRQHTAPLPPKERGRILETGVYSQRLTKSRLPLD